MAGIDLLVTPRRRQALIADSESLVPDSNPRVTDLDDCCYFGPEHVIQAIVGGQFGQVPPQDPDEYKNGHDLDWAGDVDENAGTVAYYFEPNSCLVCGWASMR